MSPKSVMVFCAGYGTRMGALVSDRPKPLIEVSGRSLLDWTLDLIDGAGIAEVVVNTHYMGWMIKEHLAQRPIKISHEAEEILDTGGGLKAALPLLGQGPVFTANADTILFGPNPFLALAETWEPELMGALLLLVPRDRALGRVGGGDFAIAKDGRLTRGGDLVYTGIQILETEPVTRVEKSVFSLNLIWDVLEEKGRLFGVLWNGDWVDVGHPEGIRIAEELIESRSVD